MAIVNVARRQIHRRAQRLVGIFDVVVLLETGLQPTQDLVGFLGRRLGDVDLLEASRQCSIFLEDTAILLIGGGTDTLHLPGSQHRLDQVRGVHYPTGGRAGTDDGVDLVDEQDRVSFLAQLRQDRLQALLEIAAILGAGHHRAQIQRVDGGVAQHLRHLAVDDHLRQSFGDGGLADPGFTDEQGIVLAPPAQDLNGAFDLIAPADQRVDTPLPRQFVQVAGEVFQRLGVLVFGALLALRRGGVLLVGYLGNPVRDEIHHVQPADFLLFEKIDRLRFLLAENSHQHVSAGDLLVAGGLDMQHRPLQHPLETQGRLRLARVIGPQQGGMIANERLQVPFQLIHMGAAGPQHFRRSGIVQQGQQQVLHGHELMAPVPCLAESKIDGKLQILAQHNSHLELRWVISNLGFFHGAQQRMLVPAGKFVDLHHLGFRNLVSEDAAYPLATGMNVQHHLGRLLLIHPEKTFQDPYHELHGSIVIVQQDHLIQRWLLEFGLCRLHHQAAVLIGSR